MSELLRIPSVVVAIVIGRSRSDVISLLSEQDESTVVDFLKLVVIPPNML